MANLNPGYYSFLPQTGIGQPYGTNPMGSGTSFLPASYGTSFVRPDVFSLSSNALQPFNGLSNGLNSLYSSPQTSLSQFAGYTVPSSNFFTNGLTVPYTQGTASTLSQGGIPLGLAAYGNPYSYTEYVNSLAYENALQGWNASKSLTQTSGERLPNFADHNERMLYDINRLASGASVDDILEDIWKIAEGTFYNADFSEMQNASGFGVGAMNGGMFDETIISAQQTENLKIPAMENERKYLTEFIRILGQGSEGIRGLMVRAGLPDNQATSYKAQEIFNRIQPKLNDLNYKAAQVAENMKTREQDLKSNVQLTKTNKQRTDQIFSNMTSTFGGGGGGGNR